MKIALTAEGTYPHQFGGVSVWCDQLVRGLPDYDFDLVALVATGAEPVRWELPGNVAGLKVVPLWGDAAPGGPGVALAAAPVRPAGGRADRRAPGPGRRGPGPVRRRHARAVRVRAAGEPGAELASERSVAAAREAWRRHWQLDQPPPTLQDAVTAIQLLEHALRPLAHPPPRADVVHAVTNGLGALPALAARWRYGTPMVVTEHGMYMREHYLHSRQAPYRLPVKQLYLQFLRRLCVLGYEEATVITPGNVYNKRWEAQLGADVSRIRTVYNGVNPADFPALDSEPEVPTISWAGRIDPIKDLESLLRAFALVREELPDARLRIFGSPRRAGRGTWPAARSLAADLGLDGAVTFEGRVAQIRDAYAAGQVVVLCSISEGFPYTLIEAMTCGRPCVATDVGGVTEAIGDTGLVVPPRRPADLARACLALLRDDDRRAPPGRRRPAARPGVLHGRPGGQRIRRDLPVPGRPAALPRAAAVRRPAGPGARMRRASSLTWRRPDERRRRPPVRRGLAPVDQPDRLRSITAAGTDTLPRTVADLCTDFAEVCESAVDPLEIASALEFDGLSDR